MKNIPLLIMDRFERVPPAIDGVIGWPELSRMVIELDGKRKTITLRPSYREERGPKNLFWIGVPVISVMGGEPREIMLFCFDSMAHNVFFNENGLEKTNAEKVGKSRTDVIGLVGKKNKRCDVINLSGLFIDGSEFVFNNHINDGAQASFSGSCGVIGSLIAQAGKVRINYPEGRLVFEPYPSE